MMNSNTPDHATLRGELARIDLTRFVGGQFKIVTTQGGAVETQLGGEVRDVNFGPRNRQPWAESTLNLHLQFHVNGRPRGELKIARSLNEFPARQCQVQPDAITLRKPGYSIALTAAPEGPAEDLSSGAGLPPIPGS